MTVQKRQIQVALLLTKASLQEGAFLLTTQHSIATSNFTSGRKMEIRRKTTGDRRKTMGDNCQTQVNPLGIQSIHYEQSVLGSRNPSNFKWRSSNVT